MSLDPDAVAHALEFRLGNEYSAPGILKIESVIVKKGPQAYKSASLLTFGDKDTGESRHREFRVQTWKAREAGGGYEFEGTPNAWSCNDEEIERLRFLLNQELTETGTYAFVDESSALGRLVRAMRESPEALGAIAGMDEAAALTDLVQRRRRRNGLDAVRRVVEDPRSSENAIQRVLQDEWWIFGARFVSRAARRSYMVLDQFDIPLLRADGSLHVVELKQANIAHLIDEHRNHFIAGREVHSAVAQTMNYLRALDEQRAQILTEFGIECRRAFATVVVGHPIFSEHDESDVAETIRTYNSHLTRIEVLTYKDLLDGAERALITAADDDDAPDSERRGEDPF